MRKIIVLYNRPQSDNPDDTDTQKSALGVVDGLIQAGYDCDSVGITRTDIDSVSNIQTDLVFNLVEWAGRDYPLGVQVINNLEAAGLSYTGSAAWGYRVSCDKVLMKKLLVKNEIPTPRYQIVENFKFKISNLKFPLIVKPAYEHAAIGISQQSVVTKEGELKEQVMKLIKEYDQPVLVEEFVDGDEAQVTVLEKNGRPRVLPPAVFRYQKKSGYWPINTYDAKWGEGWESTMSDWVDKSLPPSLASQVQELATKCYVRLGGRSYPRVDMRVSGDSVYVLEVNNNPGIDWDPESGIAVSAKKAGLDWPGLLTNIVEEAYDAAVV